MFGMLSGLMKRFLKRLYHYMFTCGFKGHNAASHHVDSLFSNLKPLQVSTVCTRCWYPIIIYRTDLNDDNDYWMIEDN